MESKPLMHKFLKYVLCGLSAYFILQYVAKNKMSDTDMILIATIVMLLFIIVDYVIGIMSNENKEECTSVCSAREHFFSSTYTPSMHDVAPEAVLPSIPFFTPTEQPRPSEPAVPVPVEPVKPRPSEPAVPVPVEPVKPKPNVIDADYAKVLAAAGQLINTSLPNGEISFKDKISRNEDGSYNIQIYHNPQADSIGSRSENGVLRNEMQYSDYNTLPQNLNSGSFEYGYSFLPPANWYPVPPHPPVCVTEKQCRVCPVYTNGTNVDLKEWDSARRITY
jgi:hypothetical protein